MLSDVIFVKLIGWGRLLDYVQVQIPDNYLLPALCGHNKRFPVFTARVSSHQRLQSSRLFVQPISSYIQ
jgi:hypothetical protein